MTDKLVQIHPFRGHDDLPAEARIIPSCVDCRYRVGVYADTWRCAAYGGRQTADLPISELDGHCDRWKPTPPPRSLLRWLYDVLLRFN